MITAVDVLSGRPCAITEDGLRLVLAVVSRDEFFADARQRMLAGRDEDDLENDHKLSIVDGTAVIQVEGPLFAKANMMTRLSGATSYQMIRRDLKTALEDSAVKRILWLADSPGGDAKECNETADLIYAARGKKPMWAFVTGQCASACTWLLSQVDRIYAAETAYVGCIGVLSAIVDTSAADEKAGVRKIEIVSSRAPRKRSYPIDDSIIARAQEHCDELEAIFIDKVARGRSVSAATVAKKFGQGDSIIAADALEVGLIDGVSSIEQVMQDFAASEKTSPFLTGATTMAKQNPAATFRAEEKKPEDDKAKKASEKEQGEAKKAEDDKPEDKAADSVKCMHCGGDGFMDDGSKCETCGGTGEMEKAKKAENDGDADDKAEDDMGEAKKALAKLAGMSASASLSQITAALQARTAPLSEIARLQAENTKLAAGLEALQVESIGKKAEAYVGTAIREGRTTKDKAQHLVGEFTKAEKAQKDAGAKALEPLLFAKGTFTLGKIYSDGKGSPLGKDDKATDLSQPAGDDVAAEFAACASAIVKAEKVPYAKAMTLVKVRNPEVYARYHALRSARR